MPVNGGRKELLRGSNVIPLLRHPLASFIGEFVVAAGLAEEARVGGFPDRYRSTRSYLIRRLTRYGTDGCIPG